MSLPDLDSNNCIQSETILMHQRTVSWFSSCS